jgi:adenosylcobinamide-GDP ribazoletransferase
MNFAKISGLFLDLGSAFVLLSRLPVPRLPDAAFEYSARAVWSYSIVGAVLGALATLSGVLAMTFEVPPAASAGLALAVLIVTAGAMHEDGLADTADGFWGGHTPEQRLFIMKDSQIGSYGTLSLIMVTGLRWSAITALLAPAPAAIIAATALSRGFIPLVMRALPPARKSGLSQGVGRPDLAPVLCALALGFVIALFAVGKAAVVSLMLCLVVSGACVWLAGRKIKGQTGDVLGATQQLCEAGTLCLFAAMMA